ncbi:BtrH N-terminal domain-containing protein [Chrysiogenes arsenatis]|uniref:BtrH N-terminal domain-containing protein n=1 Tax=Chrysiogenes arsenatis TaxID=309797 RepID=UPI0003F562C9|nr:BtrH N-terminal domain-containing protein [Chrysiogenes arsenatis]
MNKPVTEIPFVHRHAAHCESGVSANLFAYGGFPISEAMAFGIGGGLFFAYLPFIRIDHLPLVTFRKEPGGILRQAAKRLGMSVQSQHFRTPEKASQALDTLLEQGIPVGLQTGVYWLPYFPPALRFHFNAHNLVVYGRQGDDYLISDPVLDQPVICHRHDLERARFARGALAPKGRMYWIPSYPQTINLPSAIREGIREVANRMTRPFLPIAGTRGIRFLAYRLEKWPERLGEKSARRHLGHLIRMQEEIGTGGGGFRFIYAAFLCESASILERTDLERLSDDLTLIGDRWRDLAVLGTKLCKGRAEAGATWHELGDLLRECADREQVLFTALRRLTL